MKIKKKILTILLILITIKLIFIFNSCYAEEITKDSVLQRNIVVENEIGKSKYEMPRLGDGYKYNKSKGKCGKVKIVANYDEFEEFTFDCYNSDGKDNYNYTIPETTREFYAPLGNTNFEYCLCLRFCADNVHEKNPRFKGVYLVTDGQDYLPVSDVLTYTEQEVTTDGNGMSYDNFMQGIKFSFKQKGTFKLHFKWLWDDIQDDGSELGLCDVYLTVTVTDSPNAINEKIIEKRADAIKNLYKNGGVSNNATEFDDIICWANGVFNVVGDYQNYIPTEGEKEELERMLEILETGSSKWNKQADDVQMEHQITDEFIKECKQLMQQCIDAETLDDAVQSDDVAPLTYAAYRAASQTLSTMAGNARVSSQYVDVFENISAYIPGYSTVEDETIEKFNIIISVITTVIMIISVIVLAILGIKYVLGSVEEKAEYKQDLIAYVIGCILVFGISGVVKLTLTIGESITNIM